MEDFIRGAIKGMLIVIVPIAVLLALGIIALSWSWLKYIVYIFIGFILWTILLIILFPEIKRHDLGWPLTYGYIWRKIWPFRKKYGTASNRRVEKRLHREAKLRFNKDLQAFLLVFGIIGLIVLFTFLMITD